MNILPWIIVIIVILVAAYLISQNKKSTIQANNTIIAATSTIPCIPFTQAQQDVQKRDMLAKCTNKLLVPFVGIAQYAACTKNVNDSLTPINNC